MVTMQVLVSYYLSSQDAIKGPIRSIVNKMTPSVISYIYMCVLCVCGGNAMFTRGGSGYNDHIHVMCVFCYM